MNKYNNKSNLSRTGSTGSLTSTLNAMSTSDNQNNQQPVGGGGMSDDEDSDGRSNSALSYKERRREAHTQAEQKRRDAIKKGYEYLQDLVPTVAAAAGGGDDSGSPGGGSSGASPAVNAKASKAVVLQKAIDYIQYIEGQKKKQENEINARQKELVALQIMRDNYEQLVKAHQSSTLGGEAGSELAGEVPFVPSEVKFKVFQLLMDSLFMSFNEKVSMSNFQELSRCVISWLEEQCTPHMLQDLMLSILEKVKMEESSPNANVLQHQEGARHDGRQSPPNLGAAGIDPASAVHLEAAGASPSAVAEAVRHYKQQQQ